MADSGDSTANGPGPALRTAREGLGISVEDVAGAMKVPVATVEHIEENAFDTLPAPPFTRGYIRTYARLLGLDGDELVRQYGEAILDEGEARLVVQVEKPSLAELPQRHPGWVFGGAVFAVAVAGAAVLWWAWPQEPEPRAATDPVAVTEPPRAAPGTARTPVPARSPTPTPRPAPTPTVVDAPDGDAAGEPPLSAATDPGAPGLPDPEVTAPDEAVLAMERGRDEDDGAEAPAVAQPVVDAPVEAAREPFAAGADVLEFAFVGDCWVEVFDREGRIVHMDMSLAGDSLRLRGEAPFSIRLGNAPATTLAFNGEPIALAPHTRANVANLVLGE